MFLLNVLAGVLAWLGRQGTAAIAALVFIGIAVPPIGGLLKPWVTEAVFTLLCIAFLRLDRDALRQHRHRPALALAGSAWTSLAIPVLFGAGCLAVGLDASAPELFLALMVQAIASPLMAAPAFAALMGLDATLVLITVVAGSVLLPATALLFSHGFIGSGLGLSPLALGLKLAAIIIGAALAAATIRRVAGPAALERRRDELDGVNILVLFVFVAAVMEDVAAAFLAMPEVVIGLAALAFLVFIAVFGLTVTLFAGVGRERALALGLVTSLRNMGLMLAATGDTLPDLVWLYCALCQLPIYLAPKLLTPLAQRLRRRYAGNV